jgi:glycerophosphoryl diester phosphodiesterase
MGPVINSKIKHDLPMRRSRKKRFTLRTIYITLSVLCLAYFTLYLLVIPERENQTFLRGNEALNIAYRGGASLAPENTLIALEKARLSGANVIHLDVRMTLDGELVVIHDETINRTTNGSGAVHELTLAEIRQFNAGHHFRDIRGRTIYRAQDVPVPTVLEVFEHIQGIRLMIELKPPPARVIYEQMEEKLWQLIESYQLHSQVLVYSSSHHIMERFAELSQGSVALGTPLQEVQRFTFLHRTLLHRLYRPKQDVIVVPKQQGVFSLNERQMVEAASRYNMTVIYKDVNQEQTMHRLLINGVHGIMTERPDLLRRLMNEMRGRDGQR